MGRPAPRSLLPLTIELSALTTPAAYRYLFGGPQTAKTRLNAEKKRSGPMSRVPRCCSAQPVLSFEWAQQLSSERDSKAFVLDQHAGGRSHANRTTPSPSALSSHGSRHRRTRTRMNQAMPEPMNRGAWWSPRLSPSAFSIPSDCLDADGCF